MEKLANKLALNNTLKSILLFILFFSTICKAQDEQLDESFISYSKPNKYKIGGISVSGTEYLDPSAIIAVTGFKIGDEIQIPGDALTTAIRKLWDQGILGDIKVTVTKIVGDEIFFDFNLRERPRLSKFVFYGIKKTEEDELKEKIRLIKGRTVTDVMIKNTQKKIKNYYAEKGYNTAKITILQVKDTVSTGANQATLRIVINKGKKIKVEHVEFVGNNEIDDDKLTRKLKETKRSRLIIAKNVYFLNGNEIRLKTFRKKFIKSKYEEDKKKNY